MRFKTKDIELQIYANDTPADLRSLAKHVSVPYEIKKFLNEVADNRGPKTDYPNRLVKGAKVELPQKGDDL